MRWTKRPASAALSEASSQMFGPPRVDPPGMRRERQRHDALVVGRPGLRHDADAFQTTQPALYRRDRPDAACKQLLEADRVPGCLVETYFAYQVQVFKGFQKRQVVPAVFAGRLESAEKFVHLPVYSLFLANCDNSRSNLKVFQREAQIFTSS